MRGRSGSPSHRPTCRCSRRPRRPSSSRSTRRGRRRHVVGRRHSRSAWCRGRPAGSVVEEGCARRRGVRRSAPRAPPDLSSSSRQGRHELAVDNHGNAPIPPAFVALDPRTRLRFESTVGAHRRAGRRFASQGAPQGPFRRGQPKLGCRSYVAAETVTIPSPPTAPAPATAPAALVLEGRACRARPVLLLFILWKTLLEPSIESTARDSAEEVVADEVEAIDERLDARDPRSAVG